MKAINRDKVYIFFWGTNSSLGPSAESRRVDLFDTSDQALGSIYFYPLGAEVPNDSRKDGQIFMHRPVSDYDNLVPFIQKSPGDVYFNFEGGEGNNYAYVSNHLY